MRSGSLDRKITIQKKTVSQNTFGEEVETWSTFSKVWAKVIPLRGQERFESKQVNAELDTMFRIRYLTGVLPTMRIVHETRLYDIHSVAEIGRREGLDLLSRVRLDAESI